MNESASPDNVHSIDVQLNRVLFLQRTGGRLHGFVVLYAMRYALFRCFSIAGVHA